MESASCCHLSGSAFIWARNGRRKAPSPLLFRTVKTGRSCKYKGQILKSMYEHVPSIDRGYLKVTDIYTLYYEIFGNPVGKPAVFLHGGPGAGCAPRHARFFDPSHYKVVLFDQRGCGKSTPCGCLEENTTWDLVEDLEKLRKHLREPSSKTINALEETKETKTDSAYSFSNQKLACVEAGKNHETTISKMTPQLAQARLECHYFLNAGFLKESQLLKGISNIRHIPCVIVHGRYDFVCPVKNAFDLHRAWPEAKLCIVMDAGHSMYEKGITRELLSATEQLMSVVS
ncbi:hypothetical protein L7F22_011721 [Adiantum nelumboides]|nr:hypothetical protein [Adiantum nelumboides]